MGGTYVNIYEKLLSISRDASAVAKNLTVGIGKSSYKAVGEADVLAAVKPLEAKYGVYSYPISRRIINAEVYTAKNDYGEKSTQFVRLETVYPKCESLINFLCCCNSTGDPRPNIQLVINSSKYMRDFINEFPPDFRISAKCCDYCKKQVAHKVQKDYDMIITGERRDEGGMRSVPRKDNTSLCFTETASGQYRLRPLYYVSDDDKAWYKSYYGIRYSDAYEVYGLKRTGCCGCPISYRAVDDLEIIREYEPNVVKAAWNIFGKSYEYRQKYNAYKADRLRAEKDCANSNVEGQMTMEELIAEGSGEA